MEIIRDTPLAAVEFNKSGGVVDRAQVDAVLSMLRRQREAGTPITDLLVLSHGWNNNMEDARSLYDGILEHCQAVIDAGKISGPPSRVAVVGVLWPSKKFTDEQLIPGGAADVGEGPIPLAHLEAQLDNLIAAVEDPARTALLEQARAQLPNLEDDPQAREVFAQRVRAAIVPETSASGSSSGAAASEDAEGVFFTLSGEKLFEELGKPTFAPPVEPAGGEDALPPGIGGLDSMPGDGGSGDGAAGLGDILGGIKSGARNLLNLTTYYLMKARAGTVGRTGVYSLLREVAAAEPGLRLHLAGHSFGGRLVTAAALGPDGAAVLPIRSMTLLQAAYSHNGLSPDWDGLGHAGAFRNVVAQGRVDGPIVITHTVNDKAVGLAYPLASRLSGDDASSFGGPDDRFGGMGRNGAQHTPEAQDGEMLAAGAPGYSFQGGKIYNLRSDHFIHEHSDLKHDEVAYALLTAVQAGGSTPAAPADGSGAGGGGAVVGAPAAEADSGGAASLGSGTGGGSSAGASGPGDGSALGEGRRFHPSDLDTAVIAIPLLEEIRRGEAGRPEVDPLPPLYEVIIDLNLNYDGGDPLGDPGRAETAPGAKETPVRLPVSSRERASDRVHELLDRILNDRTLASRPVGKQGINEEKSRLSTQYLFAELEAKVIKALVEQDGKGAQGDAHERAPQRGVSVRRAIYRIWNDPEVHALLTHSISTVKANAAHAAFGAMGHGIVWAVMDSGIQGTHRHFIAMNNLDVPKPLRHTDFTGSSSTTVTAPAGATADPAEHAAPSDGAAPAGGATPAESAVPPDPALVDDFGHGTHVAGIIAGSLQQPPIVAISRHRDEAGVITYKPVHVERISGIAPECKLLSLKVLNEQGRGKASNIIAAINYVQEINGFGRKLQIHGVNLSVGYGFEPEWFACGQSPLCVEVDRLVRSGVVVVVAAGNTGYGYNNSLDQGAVAAGMALSINDPGNADLAITVGATHRDMPHVYGVSYFSSKGPTGDGREKPDLVAPGEKILSCAAGQHLTNVQAKVPTLENPCDYIEDSGTSMAAPHVSGAIAAFLSVRREYIGRPEEVKEIFCSSATDLRRQRHFQGHGLVDLMRAIQSV